MTTCARLAQNVRPLGGLVRTWARPWSLVGLLPLVGGLHEGRSSKGPASSYLIVDSLAGRVRREAGHVRRAARRPT